MHPSPPLAHLDYVVDLASFSMLFRPRASDTEVVQFTRIEYTPDAAHRVRDEIRACLPSVSAEWSEAAAYVFAVVFKTERLRVADQCVLDLVDQGVFDFSSPAGGTPRTFEAADLESAFSPDLRPTSNVFDLLESLQPNTRRYAIDERITPANKATSDFVTQKQAMDYLYQNGVFGTFDDL